MAASAGRRARPPAARGRRPERRGRAAAVGRPGKLRDRGRQRVSAGPAVASDPRAARVPGAAPQVRGGDARGPWGRRAPSAAPAWCSRAAVNGLRAGEGRGPRKPGGRLHGEPPESQARGARPRHPDSLADVRAVALGGFTFRYFRVLGGRGGPGVKAVSVWGRARCLPSARSPVSGSSLRGLPAVHPAYGWRPVSGVEQRCGDCTGVLGGSLPTPKE